MALHHHAHDTEELCAEIDALHERVEHLQACVDRIEMMLTVVPVDEPAPVAEAESDHEEIAEAIDEHEHGTHDHEEREETDAQIEAALEQHEEEHHAEGEGDAEDDPVVVTVDDTAGLPQEEHEDEEHRDEAHTVPFGRG